MAATVRAIKLDRQDSNSWAIYAAHRCVCTGLKRSETAAMIRKIKEEIARDPFYFYY